LVNVEVSQGGLSRVAGAALTQSDPESGKPATLARFASESESALSDVSIISHFIGASPRSTACATCSDDSACSRKVASAGRMRSPRRWRRSWRGCEEVLRRCPSSQMTPARRREGRWGETRRTMIEQDIQPTGTLPTVGVGRRHRPSSGSAFSQTVDDAHPADFLEELQRPIWSRSVALTLPARRYARG
jgi:hypothetical protein